MQNTYVTMELLFVLKYINLVIIQLTMIVSLKILVLYPLTRVQLYLTMKTGLWRLHSWEEIMNINQKETASKNQLSISHFYEK